jgi:hypothetical protein
MSRALIAAPALIPPALVGLIFLFGIPQSLTSALSGADPLEPNDSLAESLPLGAGVTANMRCGPGDVDWFSVTIPAGKCLQLTTSPPASDRGATSVHSTNGTTLVQAESGEDRCVYSPAGLKGESVHVRVWGQRRSTYSLGVEFKDPAVRFEPNDEQKEATPIGLGTYERLTCNGDDWFRVFQPTARPLTVTVDSDSGIGVRVFPTTATVAPVVSALPGSAVVPPVGAGRPLLVHVSGRGNYSLDLLAGSSASSKKKDLRAPVPVFTDSLEPNDKRKDAAPLNTGRYTRLRCNGKDWYVIDVPKNSTLALKATFKRNRGDLQLKLEYPLPGRRTPGSRYGVHKGDGYTLRHFATETAQLRLLVSGSRIPYTLTVEITPGLPGVEIEAGEYPDLFCAGTDEWRLSLKKGDRLEVELSNDVSEGWLELTILDPTWSSRGSSSSGSGMIQSSYTAREDGPVFLRVTGASIRYQLVLSLERGERPNAFVAPRSETIGPGVYPKRRLDGDSEAYYAIQVGKLGRLMVEASFSNSTADIDLELIDGAGRKVTSSATSDDVEHLEHGFTEAQTVYARVYTYDEKPSDYELTIALNERSRPRPGAVPTLTPGRHRVDAPTGNDVFALALTQGDRLRASITHSTTDGANLSLGLLDGRGRESARSTDGEGKESLQFTSPTDQTVYLRIHGPKPLRFDLDVAVAARSE